MEEKKHCRCRLNSRFSYFPFPFNPLLICNHNIRVHQPHVHPATSTFTVLSAFSVSDSCLPAYEPQLPLSDHQVEHARFVAALPTDVHCQPLAQRVEMLDRVADALTYLEPEPEEEDHPHQGSRTSCMAICSLSRFTANHFVKRN
jgi:hypothetical protein